MICTQYDSHSMCFPILWAIFDVTNQEICAWNKIGNQPDNNQSKTVCRMQLSNRCVQFVSPLCVDEWIEVEGMHFPMLKTHWLPPNRAEFDALLPLFYDIAPTHISVLIVQCVLGKLPKEKN
jgi:hypothetical protein